MSDLCQVIERAAPGGRWLRPHDRFLLGVLARVRRRIAAEVAAAITANLAMVAMALLAGRAAAHLERGHGARWWLVVALCAAGLVEAIGSAAQQVQGVRAAVEVFVHNRRAVVDVAHRHGARLGPLGRESSVLAMGTTDSENIDVLVHLFGSMAGAAFGVLATAVAAATIAPLLGGVVVATSITAGVLMTRAAGQLWRRSVDVNAAKRTFAATAAAAFDGVETVLGLGMAPAVEALAADRAGAARSAGVAQQRLEARIAAVGRLAGVAVAATIAASVARSRSGWSVADAVAAIALLGGLVPVLAQLAGGLGQLLAARAGAERLAQLLPPDGEQPVTVDGSSDVRDGRSAAGGCGPGVRPADAGHAGAGGGPAVLVAGASVREGGRRLLHDVSLTVAAGERVLLCGPTGSGKSVLLSVLDGTRRSDAGVVRVLGGDPWRSPAARAHRAVAEQHPFLYDDDLAQNVGLGRASASAVVAALWTAAADELPDAVGGRRLGRRGRGVSGGQRRRITVARALAAGTPVLLLDDPTAGLDAASEARLLARLGADRHRTMVLAGNSRAVARWVDRVVVLEAGVIAAAGRYDELLVRSAAFRALMTPTVHGHDEGPS